MKKKPALHNAVLQTAIHRVQYRLPSAVYRRSNKPKNKSSTGLNTMIKFCILLNSISTIKLHFSTTTYM